MAENKETLVAVVAGILYGLRPQDFRVPDDLVGKLSRADSARWPFNAAANSAVQLVNAAENVAKAGKPIDLREQVPAAKAKVVEREPAGAAV